VPAVGEDFPGPRGLQHNRSQGPSNHTIGHVLWFVRIHLCSVPTMVVREIGWLGGRSLDGDDFARTIRGHPHERSSLEGKTNGWAVCLIPTHPNTPMLISRHVRDDELPR
jgi:hypothetical protein